MDRKSKFLILVFIIVILVSIFLTYKRSFVDKDFEVMYSEEEYEEESEEEADLEDAQILETEEEVLE